jgi:[ribosomal protein S18]-alanine N-acetyltransferase
MTKLRPGFSLRKAELEDLPVLLKIEKDVSPFPWSARQFSESIRQHQSQILVRGTRVVGFLFFHQVLDQAELLNIAVKRSFQNEGLGSYLLQHCLDTVADTAVCLFLEVRASNLPAIELYRKSGFEQIGQRRAYYHSSYAREDALSMAYDFRDAIHNGIDR